MKFIFTTFFLIIFFFAFAQNESQNNHEKNSFFPQQNFLYVEAGGNGLFGSINYERQLTKKPGLGLRFGIGFYTENAFYLTIPVGINYLLPINGNSTFIDAGLGLTMTKINANLFTKNQIITSNNFNNFIPSIGFRKHATRNLMWRASISPVINRNGFVPWLGLSVGRSF